MSLQHPLTRLPPLPLWVLPSFQEKLRRSRTNAAPPPPPAPGFTPFPARKPAVTESSKPEPFKPKTKQQTRRRVFITFLSVKRQRPTQIQTISCFCSNAHRTPHHPNGGYCHYKDSPRSLEPWLSLAISPIRTRASK